MKLLAVHAILPCPKSKYSVIQILHYPNSAQFKFFSMQILPNIALSIQIQYYLNPARSKICPIQILHVPNSAWSERAIIQMSIFSTYHDDSTTWFTFLTCLVNKKIFETVNNQNKRTLRSLGNQCKKCFDNYRQMRQSEFRFFAQGIIFLGKMFFFKNIRILLPTNSFMVDLRWRYL